MNALLDYIKNQWEAQQRNWVFKSENEGILPSMFVYISWFDSKSRFTLYYSFASLSDWVLQMMFWEILLAKLILTTKIFEKRCPINWKKRLGCPSHIINYQTTEISSYRALILEYKNNMQSTMRLPWLIWEIFGLIKWHFIGRKTVKLTTSFLTKSHHIQDHFFNSTMRRGHFTF